MMNRSVMERQMFKDGGAAFPDLSGDGKITRKDILMGRGVQFMEMGGPPIAATGDVLFTELRKRFNLLKQDQSPEGFAKLQAFAMNEQEGLKAIGDPQITAEVNSLLTGGLDDSTMGRLTPEPPRTFNMTDEDALRSLMAPTGEPPLPEDPFVRRPPSQMMNQGPIEMQEGGVIEPPMMDPAMMAGGSPAQMMMAEQQVMDAPPEIQQAAAEEIQAGLPMVENALNQFAMNTGGKDVEDAETFEEMMNMVRGFPATTGERREELAELVGPEDASQTPDSVLAMVQPIIGLTALDQGIGSLAREELGEAPPMGGIMDMAAEPGGMMVEENIPV